MCILWGVLRFFMYCVVLTSKGKEQVEMLRKTDGHDRNLYAFQDLICHMK